MGDPHVASPGTRLSRRVPPTVARVPQLNLHLFPPIKVLVGEQSNAYRILLRYDRKSRHRRIKKQRRYERLAATSQFLYTRAKALHSLPKRLTVAPSRVGVARTLSARSRPHLTER